MLQHQAQAPQWLIYAMEITVWGEGSWILPRCRLWILQLPSPVDIMACQHWLSIKPLIKCKCTDCWTSCGRYICATVLHYNLQESAQNSKGNLNSKKKVPFLAVKEGQKWATKEDWGANGIVDPAEAIPLLAALPRRLTLRSIPRNTSKGLRNKYQTRNTQARVRMWNHTNIVVYSFQKEYIIITVTFDSVESG